MKCLCCKYYRIAVSLIPVPGLKILASNPSLKMSNVFQNWLGISEMTPEGHNDGML